MWSDLILADHQHLQSLSTYIMTLMQLMETQLRGLQHGLQAEPKPANPIGFRWRVPLSWVHKPFDVLALYRDQLDAQTHD